MKTQFSNYVRVLSILCWANTVTAAAPSIVYLGGVPNINIVFASVPGNRYDILKATSLVNPTWTIISTLTAPPAGTFEYREPATGPMAFFKTQDAASLFDLLAAVRWREPGRLEFGIDSPDGMGEQSLGIPLDAYFNPIPNATSLFPNDDPPGNFPLTEYYERRELVMTIEHRNAAILSWPPAVSTDPAKRYGVYRAMKASLLVELQENVPMATPPAGAVYYVWRVWRGWSYWQVFEGDSTTFTTDVAARFLTWTGSLNTFKSTFGIRGTEGGRGLLPQNSAVVVPRGFDAIPANFTTQGPDAVMMVEYRQIPNTQTTDGPIAW